jgi:aromatic ring-opening dioxygenase catalytic subunit (LigB family)
MQQPVYFISHGGGPWPWMRLGDQYALLSGFLSAIPSQLPEMPRAIVVISAHWETPGLEVATASQPAMIYDYYNFPPETYQVQYPAPGSPEVAAEVIAHLQAAGLSVQANSERGFDHGVFVPLAVMFPEANIPVVCVSQWQHRDPAQHMALGRALAPLRDQGVLILGSGLSYHNLRRMDASGQAPSEAFDQWLQETLVEHTDESRQQRLLAWEAAPAARVAHAQEDHLVPLFVAAGAAEQDAVQCVHHETNGLFGFSTVSSFRWG